MIVLNSKFQQTVAHSSQGFHHNPQILIFWDNLPLISKLTITPFHSDFNGIAQKAMSMECAIHIPQDEIYIDSSCRKHASLMELNAKVMDALQMYQNLMKEQPAYGYSTLPKPGHYSVPPGSMVSVLII